MKKKRLIAGAACAMTLVFAFAGCGGTDPDDPGPGKNPPNNTPPASTLTAAPACQPDYSAHAGEELPIGGFNPQERIRVKKLDPKVYSYAKEAGIDFLCDMRAAQNDTTISELVADCAANDFKCFVNLTGYQYKDVKDAPFLQSEAFLGFNFWDEPPVTGPYTGFDKLSEAVTQFKTDHPGKLAYINLLPNYATPGQMGAATFSEYVSEFVKRVPDVDRLSYDFYPLNGQMSGGTVMSYWLNQLWLPSLEEMASASKKSGKDLWTFIQCMSFGANNRAPQSKADITLQNYTNMAYGARGLQYFCLTTPAVGANSGEFGEYDAGILDRDFEPTANFTYVKEANEELAAFESVYMQFEYENTMVVFGTEDDVLYTGFDDLKSPMLSSEYFLADADYNVLVGQFHDENGYKGYMVTNFSDPLDNHTPEVKMSFNANKALVYWGGKCEVADLENGNYTFTMQEGEGRFIIPFHV